jgi:hypothetical protein
MASHGHMKKEITMMRSFPFAVLLVALPSTALAQAPSVPPCSPCQKAGSCAPADPVLSASAHTCENHSFHDHSGATISQLDATQIGFSQADLTGTTFVDSTFTGAMLYKADLTNGAMINCTAPGMVLMDGICVGTDVTGTDLPGAILFRINLTSAQLVDTNLVGAQLNNADLTAAVLSNGGLMADFRGASFLNATGLSNTVGIALYDGCTNFSGTGLDPVAAGWVLAEIGQNYCGPAVPNSSGQPGVISAGGCTVVSANSLTLTASQVPTNTFGYFLGGQTKGSSTPPGSPGILCLSGSIGRFANQVQNSGAGGSFSIPVDLTNMPPPLQQIVLPGDTWNFTAWFRDGAGVSNFTDGIEITFE